MKQRIIAYIRIFIQALMRFWPWIIGLGFLSIVLFAIGTYVFYVKDLATPESLMNRNNTGLILYDRHGDVFYKSEGVKTFHVVPFSRIPDSVKKATIAIEDKDFYKHPGFSLRSIARALYSNFLTNSPTRYGASTITQQLVKNALLSPEKSFRRKFQEIILSFEVERRYTKDQVLEMYLNSIYYGSGAYSIEEASTLYFNKEVDLLTPPEAAILAALPQAPSYLTPFGNHQDELLQRKNLVLEKMAEQGYISQLAKTDAISQTIHFAPPPKEVESVEAPHFALWVRDYLFAKYGESNVIRLGFRVETSLDLSVQRQAQTAVKQQVALLTAQHATNGALTALDPFSGEILALVGSSDWNNEQFGKFNVVFAHRQPGSSIKPIIYTQGFVDGIKTIDILHDKPTDFNGYKPKNYDGRFRGDVTVRRALANSLNIPAVELLQRVGVKNALDLAKAMGITTLSDPARYGLSLVLGGAEVELFELTRAYGVLATGGLMTPTHPILKIQDKLGKLIYSYNSYTKEEIESTNNVDEPYRSELVGGNEVRRVVTDDVAYLTTHILSDNEARKEIFGSSGALFPAIAAAVKTGTTDDYRDAWTIGYTPDIVVGVWIGNNDNSPMGKVAGSIGAAPIWRKMIDFMGKSSRSFPRPAGIVEVEICKTSYERACNACNSEDRYKEVFIKGTEPTNICPEELTPTPYPSPIDTPTPQPTEAIPTVVPSPTSIPLPTPTTAILTPTSTPLPITSIIPTLLPTASTNP